MILKRFHITIVLLTFIQITTFSQLFLGTAQNIITPTDTAFIAGHSHNRIFKGVHDDLYVKAAIFDNGSEQIILLTFDCIGLLYPQLQQIRKGLQAINSDVQVDHIVMSSTHTHSGPDVVGLWGKDNLHSGIDSIYMKSLIEIAIKTIDEAEHKKEKVYGEYSIGSHGKDWVYNISEPEELDRSLQVIRFTNDNGQSVATLTNFACHPTFLDAVNDKVSSDYIGGFYQKLDSQFGGVNMFFQGSIGGWVQPEHEEKTHQQAFYRGNELADHVIELLLSSTPLLTNTIDFRSVEIDIPVDNQAFRALSELGVIKRHFGESVQTEIAYFSIGEASFATHPGETVPKMSHDTKKLMKNEGPKFVLGLGMDAIGYILKPYFFDPERKIPHSNYLCQVSVGEQTQEVIMHALDSLINIDLKLRLEKELDSIIKTGMDSMAFPGCQVLVAHKGEILLDKAYGYHTYDKKQAVRKTDLYDLASITKVSTGLPILMQLSGKGQFDLDAPLVKYYPSFKKSNKANLTIREILAHQAKLTPYLVFWKNTIKKNGKYRIKTFKNKKLKRFPIEITDRLFLHKKYRRKMMKAIKDSDLNDIKEYRYSGLFFLLLPELIQEITQTDFEKYLTTNFYKSLGAERLLYNPLKKYGIDEIIPTEKDTIFRHVVVHGRVHDEAAAMLNGISCNAGLFGNANDLSKLFSMYMNGGSFNGHTYINPNAIKEFTSYQYPELDNRRGLGFDKPLLQYDANQSYVAKSASPESFGHSGFTGTFVWADPTHDLLVIFLSNRVYPTRQNRKLYSLNIRPNLHQKVYDLLIN